MRVISGVRLKNGLDLQDLKTGESFIYLLQSSGREGSWSQIEEWA